MSSDVAIKVENLSKCYEIYAEPRDRLKQFIFPRLRRLIGLAPKQYFREFWSLKDVSFEVKRGETVGIIGRNGSGKSTLLQMICGTLNPTNGSIDAKGRIAALLELGSGFNPEFTGRENVYMNAAVLGLAKDEIDRRFNAIADFAEIGDFIEQPVKSYSSGMMLRLAFSVIAHVDAEVLVIDEALAVGDAIFTQKCMRFLRRFMEKGTVLFVSHDTAAINNLCSRAIWLDSGHMRMHGSATEVAKAYMGYCTQKGSDDAIRLNEKNLESDVATREQIVVDSAIKISFYEDIANSDGWKSGAAEIKRVLILQADGTPVSSLAGGERLILRIEVLVNQALSSPIVGFFVKDRLGQSLFGDHTYNDTQEPLFIHVGANIVAEFIFDLPLLPNGDYSMTVSVADGDLHNHVQHHWLHDAVILHVQSAKLRYGLVGISFKSVTLRKTLT